MEEGRSIVTTCIEVSPQERQATPQPTRWPARAIAGRMFMRMVMCVFTYMCRMQAPMHAWQICVAFKLNVGMVILLWHVRYIPV
mmetsp:Transcript_31585/g.94172  ORF Transcript_31585/g.94172 Transcript_31585/m.94172 type:complete len:84 (+) Transcript_31585:975-1226(+)